MQTFVADFGFFVNSLFILEVILKIFDMNNITNPESFYWFMVNQTKEKIFFFYFIGGPQLYQ